MSRLVQKPYKTTILVRCDTIKRLYVYSAICKLICNQIQQSELSQQQYVVAQLLKHYKYLDELTGD